MPSGVQSRIGRAGASGSKKAAIWKGRVGLLNSGAVTGTLSAVATRRALRSRSARMKNAAIAATCSARCWSGPR